MFYKPNLQQWSRQGLVCLFVRFLQLRLDIKKHLYSIYTTVCTYVAAKSNKRVKMKKISADALCNRKMCEKCAGVKSYEMLRRWVMWVYILPPGACLPALFSNKNNNKKKLLPHTEGPLSSATRRKWGHWGPFPTYNMLVGKWALTLS
jgi:hypothetical protein